jgi:hypothetical protein
MPSPFFFVHVMKTGGTSLRIHAEANFAPDEVFPPQDLGRFEAMVACIDVSGYLAVTPEQRRVLRFYSGHVPLAVADLAVPEALTITLVRDPVGRTLSYLKQSQRDHPEHRALSLEEIYDDPWFFPRMIENHQTKMLSMSADEVTRGQADPVFRHGDQLSSDLADQLRDDPAFLAVLAGQLQQAGTDAKAVMRFADRAPTELVHVDDARMATAIENLARIDVLGTTDHLEDLLAVLAQDHGWAVAAPIRANTTPPRPVSASFQDRIRRDNAYDQALYEQASQLRHRPRR